jgi:hypothetical protein
VLYRIARRVDVVVGGVRPFAQVFANDPIGAMVPSNLTEARAYVVARLKAPVRADTTTA